MIHFVAPAPADALSASSNLSDIGSAATARLNLETRSYSEIAGSDVCEKFGGVIFDGTSGKYIQGVTQTIGTGDFSVRVRFRMPTTTPANPIYVMGFGSVSTVAVQYGLIFYVNNAGGITLRIYGATPGSDYSSYVSGNLTAYAGKVVDVVFTRSGTTVAFYLNKVSLAMTGPTNAGSAPAWSQSVGAGYIYVGNGSTGGGQPYTSGIYKCQIFNYALDSGDVAELIDVGVVLKNRWGNFTPYTADWSSGVDSWVAYGTYGNVSRVASISDGTTTLSNVLKYTATAGSSDHGCNHSPSLCAIGKKYRIRCWVYVPSSNAVGLQVQLQDGSAQRLATIQAGVWTYVDATFIDSYTGGPYFYLTKLDSTSTWDSVGDVFYVSGFVCTTLGCTQDIDLTVGAGFYFPDRSDNNLWCEGTTTGWQHKIAMKGGEYCIVKTLAHGDINSTADNTILFQLPKKHAVLSVQFDRESAFDAGITVNVGPTGSSDSKYVSAQSLASTGIVNVSPATGNGAIESATATTPIYIKKSGGTTQGSTTVRVRVAIMGG